MSGRVISNFNLAPLLFSFLVLTSCGGGGNDTLPDVAPPPPVLSNVVSIVPSDQNENTARDIKIIVTFEKPIDKVSVTSGTFKVTNNQGDPIEGRFDVNLNEVTFSITNSYSLSSTYKVELSQLKSDDGILINDFKSSFSTTRGKWFVRQQELRFLIPEHLRKFELVDINSVTGKVVFLFIDALTQTSSPTTRYTAFSQEYTPKTGWMNSQSFILPLQGNRRLRNALFKMFGNEARLIYAGTKSATTSQTTSFTSLDWAKPEFVRDDSYVIGLETALNGNAIALFLAKNGYAVSLFKGSWSADVILNSKFPIRNNDFLIRPFVYDDGTMGVFYSTANSNGGSDIFEHLEPFLSDPVNVTTNNGS